jgi:site-specific DNA-cytosine methylase
MTDRKILTLFAGGGLFTEGAKQAGLIPAGAIELDSKKAKIYHLNHGCDILDGDIRSLADNEWGDYTNIWMLQASPPCKNSSRAKRHNSEGAKTEALYLDCELAAATVRAFERVSPRFFVLENVPAYEKTKAFQMILDALKKARYTVWSSPINAREFGVPQNRERFILIASREPDIMQRFDIDRHFVNRVGWYQSLERWVHNCKTKLLAPYQIEAIRKALDKGLISPNDVALLVGGAGSDCNKPGVHKYNDQSPTVRACEGLRSGGWRPVIVMQSDFNKPLGEAIGYKLSSRCLLALQGAPDYYLMGNEIITGFVAGNGVAVPLAAAICRELIRCERESHRNSKKTADGGRDCLT